MDATIKAEDMDSGNDTKTEDTPLSETRSMKESGDSKEEPEVEFKEEPKELKEEPRELKDGSEESKNDISGLSQGDTISEAAEKSIPADEKGNTASDAGTDLKEPEIPKEPTKLDDPGMLEVSAGLDDSGIPEVTAGLENSGILEVSAKAEPSEDAQPQDIPINDVSTDSSPSEDGTAPPVPEKDVPKISTRKKKLVGFAPEPEQDLNEHHKFLEQRRKEKLQSSPFWKTPPEFAHLERHKEGPKPLPTFSKKKAPRVKKLEDLKDLPTRAVKEISVVNKNTALNFFYHEINVPVGPDRILVDVKYGSLSSFDLEKLSKYKLNLSEVRVGLGYDFVGEIVGVGKKYDNHPSLKVGTYVFGVVNPADKKGALQTLLIANPKDVLIPISQELMEAMKKVKLKLTFNQPSSFLVDGDELDSDSDLDLSDNSTSDDVPPTLPPKQDPWAVLFELAKFCTFSSLYCRAKQALSLMESVFKREGAANIIINGADTGLGYTLAQVIASSAYSNILQSYNVILVVQDSSSKQVRRLADRLNSGGLKKFHVLPFDLENEDLVLPGEKVPINYKKPRYFATELLNCMFQAVPELEKILTVNVDRTKIDLFIDIIGSKKMFQSNVDMKMLDQNHFPMHDRLAPGVKILSLFGKSKEPLFTKLLRPKNAGSAFVSYCDFSISTPSYSVDKLVDKANAGIFNPWGLKWSSEIANLFVSKYNYYTLFDLEVRKDWVNEALQLVLANELRVKIDHVVDWRNNFRQYIEEMKERDGQTVFRVESF